MSVAVATSSLLTAPHQPFECNICHNRFTRLENLKRHAAVHSKSAEVSLLCDICGIAFSRKDLRLRHMKRKHPVPQKNKRLNNNITDDVVVSQYDGGLATFQNDVSTSNFPGAIGDFASGIIEEDLMMLGGEIEELCDEIFGTSVPSSIEEEPAHGFSSWMASEPASTTTGPGSFGSILPTSKAVEPLYIPSLDPTSDENDQQPCPSPFNTPKVDGQCHIPDGLSPRDMLYLQEDWFPTSTQTARGYQLYFTYVSPFVAFLHRSTFDATETSRCLGLSMLCLAYQFGEDPDEGGEAGSGQSLSLRCFHRARVLAVAEEEDAEQLSSKLGLIQSYWLLQVCATMYLCEEFSAIGLKLHSRMVLLARSGGLTQSASMPTIIPDGDLEALWKAFIQVESQKRTLLAVHQLDSLWYQLHSTPRLLSHLEIKHDLPCRESFWTACSATQWAHRQLAVGQSAPLMPYTDAVRHLLSQAGEKNLQALPPFDLYGAINIIQFLLTSARELSGWSSMTGLLSLERFEPLRLSLLTLEELVRPSNETTKSAHKTCCEATWEMAMIELLIWSPSHTCGFVGVSIDSFLRQSTNSAITCKAMCESANNKAVQSHINWFLNYLNGSIGMNFETPWMALYSFKVFLIAWQLTREGLAGVMRVVNINDGDFSGATCWARTVFQHRQPLRITRLIDECLDMLER